MYVVKPHSTEVEETDVFSALDIGDHCKILSVVGAGGKTTLVNLMDKRWEETGRRAVVTTTTHMFFQEEKLFLEGTQIREVGKAFQKNPVIWTGIRGAHGKISGNLTEDQRWMSRQDFFIAAEADGARRLPVKFPGAHEPVIFPGTSMVIIVMGLDGLGRVVSEVVFRSEDLAEYLKKSIHHVLTAEDYARIIEGEEVLNKYTDGAADYRVVLNKADSRSLLQQGLDIRNRLPEHMKEKIYITRLKEV